VRLRAGQQFEALDGERISVVAPRDDLAGIALEGMTAPMRSSKAAASSACLPLRGMAVRPIFPFSTSGRVYR